METVGAVLGELAGLGTEQNRKIYRRHGVVGEQFGVSYANLNMLKKRLKVDHALAQGLWASGNNDARVLACMVADPAHMTDEAAERWADDVDNAALDAALSGLLLRTTHATALVARWTPSAEEWRGRLGWHLLAGLATKEPALPDAFFVPFLAVIEREIDDRPNRAREAMNNALIAIGGRSDDLERRAVEVAGRIGPVEIDHGQTGCKTPNAASYIRKTRQHQSRPRPARAAARS